MVKRQLAVRSIRTKEIDKANRCRPFGSLCRFIRNIGGYIEDMQMIMVRIPLDTMVKMAKMQEVTTSMLNFLMMIKQELDDVMRLKELGLCDGSGCTRFNCEIFLYAYDPKAAIGEIREVLNKRMLFDAVLSWELAATH